MDKKILYSVAILLLISVLGFWLHLYYYYKEFKCIEKELSECEIVDSFELYVGNYDITIEEIYADVVFEDGILLRFDNIYYPASFYDTSYVEVDRVNDWEFETHSFLKHHLNYYTLGSLKFGKHGQLNNYISTSVVNVKEAMESREKIIGLVERIPEYPDMAMIEHLDYYERPTITFISKFKKGNSPVWRHDKFEGKFDSLLASSVRLERAIP